MRRACAGDFDGTTLALGQRLVAVLVAAIVNGILIDAARSAVQLGLAAAIVDVRMREQGLLGNALAGRAMCTLNAGTPALQILFASHVGIFFLTHVDISSVRSRLTARE